MVTDPAAAVSLSPVATVIAPEAEVEEPVRIETSPETLLEEDVLIWVRLSDEMLTFPLPPDPDSRETDPALDPDPALMETEPP
jgi:hypothetical protein